MSGQNQDAPAFVLGFDGVPWSLLRRWVADGELPNFAAMMDDGAAGPLASTAPATTPAAWPAVATGAGPDRHGLYGFQRLDSSHGHRMYTSRDWRLPPLWELVSPAVVGNVPMTYPARPFDGAMVTGMMTPTRDDDFTHPPELGDELATRVPEYRISLDWTSYEGSARELGEEMQRLVEARRTAMRLLLERDWRLGFFVFTAPDRLQHLAWDEEVLLPLYRTMDDVLGEVMERVADRDGTLYVISDHGFGPISRYVHVNTVLEQEGYLAQREADGTRGALAGLGVTKDRVRGMLSRVGLDDKTLVSHLPDAVTDAVASHVPGNHALYDVDFERTRAFLHGPGNLYVNDSRRFDDGPVDPADRDLVKREVASVLRSTTDPDTGQRALVVHDGHELFPDDDRAPDLVVRGREGFEQEPTLADRAFTTPGKKAAGHRPEGIFLARGPDVTPGSTPEDASVVDVAPTVLHAMGEPVPRSATGRVLRELFTERSHPARRAVARRDYAGGDGADHARDDGASNRDYSDVRDRLRGLGYVE